MKLGLGVPATAEPTVVVADGVETTVGEVGSTVNAPNPVVLAWLASVSKWAKRFMVSAGEKRNEMKKKKKKARKLEEAF